MTREKRKPEEDVFIRKFMDYFRVEFDEKATEIPGITDKPDLAIACKDGVIGVELSRFPSDYIIQMFHKRRKLSPNPYDEILGNLSVFPFEPHRWVHEAVQKKNKTVSEHRERIKANEMWLVLHCHSIRDDWPMSKAVEKGSREAEDLLMRFGISQSPSDFERIFYVYADGTVVALKGGSTSIPLTVSLPDGVGYPAVTLHQFALSFDVPLPGQGEWEQQFNTFRFDETIVAPKDAWVAGRGPNIERPKFAASIRATSERAEFTLFRDGIPVANQNFETTDVVGQTMYMAFVLQWSIQQTTFTYTV